MKNPEPLISQLFVVIKHKLKTKSITYRDVAYALQATEISVKRWFAEERMSIRQISAIANLLGLTLTELIQEAEEPPLQQLTLKQETEIVNDSGLRAVMRCALNNMTLKQIVEQFSFTEAECIRYLVRLDRLRVIDLLPGNQIRVRISRDFDLLPGGPAWQYVLKDGLPKFVQNDFNGLYDDMCVLRACLSVDAIKQFQVYVRRLKRQLLELHEESFAVPIEQRHNFIAYVLHREFEADEITALRRPGRPNTARG